MKKVLYGGLVGILFNYCIGITYLLYKLSYKEVK